MDAIRLGKHVLIDIKTDRRHLLIDERSFEEVLVNICRTIGATVLCSEFRSFGEGFGFTGVVVLAESHATIHTWPEHGMACLDIFTCGAVDPEDAVPLLNEYFQTQAHSLKIVERPVLRS